MGEFPDPHSIRIQEGETIVSQRTVPPNPTHLNRGRGRRDCSKQELFSPFVEQHLASGPGKRQAATEKNYLMSHDMML